MNQNANLYMHAKIKADHFDYTCFKKLSTCVNIPHHFLLLVISL